MEFRFSLDATSAASSGFMVLQLSLPCALSLLFLRTTVEGENLRESRAVNTAHLGTPQRHGGARTAGRGRRDGKKWKID